MYGFCDDILFLVESNSKYLKDEAKIFNLPETYN